MAKSKAAQMQAGYQPAAEASVNPADLKPPTTRKMVPAQSVSVTVDEVAMQIFIKTYMDTASYDSEHLTNKAFDAAEKFVEVAKSRKTQNV